jgi:hypothetical protein
MQKSALLELAKKDVLLNVTGDRQEIDTYVHMFLE